MARSSRPASARRSEPSTSAVLQAAGLDAMREYTTQLTTGMGTEIYPDGTTACHREYPFRPDAKISGSYTLPWDILLAGTYQYSRGVQTGGAGPSIQANFAIPAASAAGLGARSWTGAASRTVQLIREGLIYGDHNLTQLDVRLSKRFNLSNYRFRLDFDVYNLFNSSWPYHGQLDLLGRGEQQLAAADQRPPEPLLQARRAVLVLRAN